MKATALTAALSIVVLGGLALGTTAAQAQARSKFACTVYEKFNFGGKSFGVGPNGFTARSKASNRISSVRVRPGCMMVAFPEVNFRGPSAQFSRDTPVVNTTWNNVISSYRCVCR